MVIELVSFLHTADWQIGMKASRVADVAERVRKARLDTAKQLIRIASQLQVDFVLIAGDLFENNLVHNEAAHRVAEALSACSPIPVYVLPGNHDPLTADSIYSRSAFTDFLPPNVHILRTSEPVTPVPGVVLLPAPVMSKESYNDPTGQFQIPEDIQEDTIVVGIAHGSLRIPGKFQENDFPIALDAAQRLGLDYLALGHWHSFYVHNDMRTVYAGTHEPTGFDGQCSASAAHVTIKARGSSPDIERLDTGTLTWQTLEVSVAGDPDQVVSRVKHEVDKAQDPSSTLLRLVLKGHAESDDLRWLEELEDWLRTSLLYMEIDKSRFITRPVGRRLRQLAAGNLFLQSIISDLADIACLLGQPIEDLPEDLVSAGGSGSSLIDDSLQDSLDRWRIEAEDVEEALRTLASIAEEVLS
jgi:DNA repair exonuclease SbcCD nuclease subunit